MLFNFDKERKKMKISLIIVKIGILFIQLLFQGEKLNCIYVKNGSLS